jgi:transcriptional regulator
MTPGQFLPGTLDMLVLQSLVRRRRHGYEIARIIERASGGRLRVLDGALYASLHRLERQGLIVPTSARSALGKAAKFYELTGAGRRQYRAEVTIWFRYVTTVARVMRQVS